MLIHSLIFIIYSMHLFALHFHASEFKSLQFHLPKSYTWILVALVGLLLVAGFYLWAWFYKVGRGMKRRSIIVQYEPPEGLSPAAIRYLMKMYFDYKAFAAAVVDLIVKGRIKISETGNEYQLTCVDNAAPISDLPAEEEIIMRELFAVDKSVNFGSENLRVQTAIKEVKKSLPTFYNKDSLFSTNWKYISIGILLTIVLLTGIAFYTSKTDFDEPAFNIKLIVRNPFAQYDFGPNMISFDNAEPSNDYVIGTILLLWGALFIAITILSLWRRNRGISTETDRYGEVFSILLGMPWFIFGITCLLLTSTTYTLFLICAIFLNSILMRLIPTYTEAGRQLADKIGGFRRYIATVQQDSLDRLHPVSETPEIFNKYLPYALALDVEQQWAEKFSVVLAEVGQAYLAGWYSNHS